MKITRSILAAAAFLFTFLVGTGSYAAVTATASLLAPLTEQKSDLPAIELSAAPASVVETEPEMVVIEQTPLPDEFYAGGVFVHYEESLPTGFSDLNYLEIITHNFEKTDENGDAGAPIPPNGHLMTGKEFNFKRISISRKHVAFQTETVDGVSYRFVGKYLLSDYEGQSYVEHLSGEIIKIVDGKWVAAADITLYPEGGC